MSENHLVDASLGPTSTRGSHSHGAADGKERPLSVIHVDLDGAAHIFESHGWSYCGADDPLFESGMRGVLELLDELALSATFFTIANTLKLASKRELLQEAVERGHEIASHTLSHRKLTRLSTDEKRREIADSRRRIEDTLGVDVKGFRAPGFQIDREALDIVASAGYRYDSSLFPDQRSALKIGVEDVTRAPHRLPNGLWELPLPGYWPLPFPFHPSYSLAAGMWYFDLGLRLLQSAKTPLVVLLHLTDLAHPLPSQYLPHWPARLYTLSFMSQKKKRQRCREMLNRIGRQYEITKTMPMLGMHTEQMAVDKKRHP